jgi:uncharacterized membrane protein
LAVAAALLRGATPVFMRAGAKRSDPSFAAALFSTALLGMSLVPVLLDGEWGAFWTVSNPSLIVLLVCGLLTAFLYLCLFTALTGAGASRVFPLVNLYEVLLVVMAYFLFDGRLGVGRICCIMLVILGTVLMQSRAARSASPRWLLYSFLALASIVCISLLNRAFLSGVVSSSIVLPFRCAVACILLWVFTLARGKQKTARSMGLGSWITILLSALSIGLALICTTLGAALGEWSWLSPIQCLGIVSMLLFARIFLKEKLPGSAVFGLLLVVLGTFAIQMGW